MTLTTHSVAIGDTTIHYAEGGDPDGPLLLMLHGFPEYWAGWADVMEHLPQRYRLVAPDQRGYNLSSRPQEVEAYKTSLLAQDMIALADHLSPGRPYVLAGHDWGSSVAYLMAFRVPDRIEKLVIANGIHPWCFQHAILHHPEQRKASQYMRTLVASNAEERLSANGYEKLFRMIGGFSQSDFMTEEKRAAYLEAWSQPGALTGMLNWYRASAIVVPAVDEKAPADEDVPVLTADEERMKVAMPHLVIWGEEDAALLPACTKKLDRFAADLRIIHLAEAGHWLLHERPQKVAALIEAFLDE